MINDFFYKIEDKKMPDDNLNNFDLEVKKSSNRGVANVLFILGIVVTAFMWIMLIFFRK